MVNTPKCYDNVHTEIDRVQKKFPLVSAKPILSCMGPQTTQFYAGQHSADNGNLRKFGSTHPHGTAFAPKQCLNQKEARARDGQQYRVSSSKNK